MNKQGLRTPWQKVGKLLPLHRRDRRGRVDLEQEWMMQQGGKTIKILAR